MKATTIEKRSKLIAGIISLAIATFVTLILIAFKIAVIKPVQSDFFNGNKENELSLSFYSENVFTKSQEQKVIRESNKIAPLTNLESQTSVFENQIPLLENYLKSKSVNTDVNHSSEQLEGIPDIKPFGNSINGSNPNYADVENKYSLENRKLISMCEIKDSKEEGIVVVKIKVNKAGQVIEAELNQRGTTTSSSVLKEKARNAALCAVFSASDKYEEQEGSITIKFEF